MTPQTSQPKPKRKSLTRAQSKRAKELMEDSGLTRAEAVAWVLAFDPDGEQ